MLGKEGDVCEQLEGGGGGWAVVVWVGAGGGKGVDNYETIERWL